MKTNQFNKEEREQCRPESWYEVLNILREFLTEPNGAYLAPLVSVIETLINRKANERFFSSLSVSRFVLLKTPPNKIWGEYVIATCLETGQIDCKLISLPGEVNRNVLRHQVCDWIKAVEVILEFAEFLK